jgi:hypothetical protein
MTTINITKQMLQDTEAYRRLDNLQQSITLKKDFFEQVRLGVNLIRFKGFELYIKEHRPTERVLMFVKEITNGKDTSVQV